MPIKLASVWSYVSSRHSTASRASDAQRRDFAAMSGSTRVAWKQRQTGEGTMHDARCTMDVSTCLHSAVQTAVHTAVLRIQSILHIHAYSRFQYGSITSVTSVVVIFVILYLFAIPFRPSASSTNLPSS